ncbi:hypothetical protein BDV93DRAFT_473944 [Ceratobasidium sp. AG-I]|nr:hypothetical protein BDV93DRAFT_473944 [Ceratobasidium sp. AG-I]
MPPRRILCITGHVALQLLKATSQVADVFPPLKSAAGGALYIAELVQSFKSNKKEWQDFHDYVRDATASVIEALSHSDMSQPDAKAKVEKLNRTLGDVLATIKSTRNQPSYKRFFEFMKDPEIIQDLKGRLENAVSLFTLSSTLITEINVTETLKAVKNNAGLLSGIALDITLGKLRYVEGASWDLYRVCLPNTRSKIIEEILTWIGEADDASDTNVFVLTGVAGAGKSTIAHTIAQRCAEQEQLVTSFFFDRDTEGRNKPNALFSTIAADLGRVSHVLAERIAFAIENDKSLPLAPISRQFDRLVLQPCKTYSAQLPLAIILDALDEGCDENLLRILCDEIPRLPRAFRIFLTSRPSLDLDSLCRMPHIRSITLNIHGPDNMSDIELFVPRKLKTISARHRNLGPEWPDSVLIDQFLAKSEGLFLWVATVCDYLCNRDDPKSEIVKLITATGASGISAASKMDKLYAMILGSCDWSDESFVKGYRRLVGTVIATKTPLTVSALNALYLKQPIASDFVLYRLSPLITGLGENERQTTHVRFLHQSLRDFLTLRAKDSPQSQVLVIDEKAHSQTLAFQCLEILNRDLDESLPDVGYLDKRDKHLDKHELGTGVPVISSDCLPEALWYACRFWIDHTLEVNLPASDEFYGLLGTFLDTKTTLWIEIMAGRGNMRGLSEIRKWYESGCEGADLRPRFFNASHASAFHSLSNHLTYDGRLEDALTSVQEAVEIRRTLAAEDPELFNPDLSASLHALSDRMSDLGFLEEGLAIIRETLGIDRQLATEQPERFLINLASSLDSLSLRLSDLGHVEEALPAIEEAVRIHRQLAERYPEKSATSLARSLNNVSLCYSELDRDEEALSAIQESLELYQQLAEESPIAFRSDVALSTNNLSSVLSSLGRRDEALKAIKAAVELYRQCVEERPAVFAPDLTMCLHNLATYFTQVSQWTDALSAAQEAVHLLRELAKLRPTVYIPALAPSLQLLSNCLFHVDRPHEALETNKETIMLYRSLVEQRMLIFSPGLAVTIHRHSLYLAKLGFQHEALSAIQEAVGIHRSLRRDSRASSINHLALSLDVLYDRFSEQKRWGEALAAVEELIELNRRLSNERPSKFKHRLSRALCNFSICLSEIGRHEEALAAIREAVELYRQLASERPATFTSGLAASLDNLSFCLSNLDYQDEALRATEEAINLQRQLVEEDVTKHASDLSRSLFRLSYIFYTIGLAKESLAAEQEAKSLEE